MPSNPPSKPGRQHRADFWSIASGRHTVAHQWCLVFLLGIYAAGKLRDLIFNCHIHAPGCANGCFLRRIAASKPSPMQHIPCCKRTQHKIRTSAVGSHPAFAAHCTKGRCRETGRALQSPFPAQSCRWRLVQHSRALNVSLEWRLSCFWQGAFAGAANDRNPPT